MDPEHRLTPTMASRKLQVYGFVRRYFIERGGSPSYGEVSKALGISLTRVRAHIRTLTKEEKIIREHGARRGISFPGPAGQVSREDALLLLLAEGYSVNGVTMVLSAPPGTFPTLPLPPELDHIPDIEIGGMNGSDAG